MTVEEWRPVVEAPAYVVSNLGRVRSHVRPRPRILRPVRERAGYLKIFLALGGGTVKQRKVHHLVAEAFIGPRPEGAEIRHLDGDRANNVASNLTWGTHAENMQDRLAHGNHPMKNRTHCPQDHEYTPENTYRFGPDRIWRACRACRREASLAHRQRRALAAANIRSAAA